MTALRRLVVLVLLALSGCVGGPSYAGGPREDQAHGTIVPGPDITLWRVDGWDVGSRGSEAYVAPGRHKLRVRFETPIESDETIPSFEFRELEVDVTDGGVYYVQRTGEGTFGPFDVQVRSR